MSDDADSTGDSTDANTELGIPGFTDAVEFGRGGFGVVYRARQPALHRTVALKLVSSRTLDTLTRERFERELQAMGTLSGHPYIVTIFDSGFTSEGRPYIVMELMNEGSVSDRMARSGPLPWPDAVVVAVKIAAALETAHRAGVLHRDIKPENVLVSSYGEPKLADFGIARVQGGPETRTGVVTASMAHAAPEVLSGARPSVATDLYALGSLLYTMIAGSPPFFADTDESIVPLITRIAVDPVPNLRTRGVPDAVCRVIERSMEKEAGSRQPSAVEFGRELQRAQSLSGLTPTDLVVSGETPRLEAADEARRLPNLPATGSMTGPVGPPPVPPSASPRIDTPSGYPAPLPRPTTATPQGPAATGPQPQPAPRPATTASGYAPPQPRPSTPTRTAPTAGAAGPAVTGRAAGAAAPARNRRWLAIAAVVVVVLAGVGAAVALMGGGSDEPNAGSDDGGSSDGDGSTGGSDDGSTDDGSTDGDGSSTDGGGTDGSDDDGTDDDPPDTIGRPTTTTDTEPPDTTTSIPPPVTGNNIEVTLTWTGDYDLDLHLVEPDANEISTFAPESASGGFLADDDTPTCGVNVGSHVERISWPAGTVPAGAYAAYAVYYDDQDVGSCIPGLAQSGTISVIVNGVVVVDITVSLTPGARSDSYLFDVP